MPPAAAVALWLAGLAGFAPPATYAEAAAPLESGDFGPAVDRLRAFAEAHPDDPDAPEALWDAAAVALDRLRDPRTALTLLDALVEQHPGSRAAARAAARRAELAARGGRDRPDLLAEVLRLNAEGDATALRAFLDAHPQAPEANLVRLRLAGLEAPPPEPGADPLIDDPEVGWRAGRALAEQAYRAADYAGSLAAAERVSDTAAADRARRMVEARAAGRLCAALALVVAARGLLRAARASTLWPPPLSVRYFAPVAALFLAAAYPMAAAFRPAMYGLALGGTALLWGLGAAPVPTTRPALRALLHGLCMLGLVFAVIVEAGLLPALQETLRNGLQR